jgi:DNA-binding NtrC family response regulator
VGNKDDEVFETLPLEGPLPDPAESVRVFRLEVTEGPAAGTSWVSSGETGVIGSDPGCDLVVADPTVSRFHCEIRLGREGARLRDTGSRNGTSVDGVRVNDAFLRGGSAVRVGRSTVRFEFVDGRNQLSLSKARQFGKLRGESVAMRQAFAVLERAAGSSATVLLEGETGTGKGLLAQAIHDLGPRAGGPFVVVDCGAISPSLIESELFGHVRGAFTGADRDREGAFAAARGGTVFLDEIGELPVETQPKLLRVLEQRAVTPVGSSRPLNLDVRIVAATNRDLRGEVNRRAFRADLYYRLNTIKLRIPPLRDRPEDIPLLVAHFFRQFGREHAPPAELVSRLAKQRWPGNVRELRSAVERAVLLGESAGGGESGPSAKAVAGESFRDAKSRATSAWEREYLRDLVDQHAGNLSRAARAVDMDRNHLRDLLRRHGLDPRAA